MQTLEHRLKTEAPHADVVEIWLDSIRDLRLAEIFFELEQLKKPCLFVNKAPFEGGDFLGTPEARVETLVEVLERGAAYVDVALATESKWIRRLISVKKKNSHLILSYHNFKETPPLAALKRTVRQARKKGADIVKIATFVPSIEVNVTLLELLRWGKAEGIPMIVVGMGEHGRLTRIAAPLLGSVMHYAPLGRGQETAPGQLTQEELKSVWALVS